MHVQYVLYNATAHLCLTSISVPLQNLTDSWAWQIHVENVCLHPSPSHYAKRLYSNQHKGSSSGDQGGKRWEIPFERAITLFNKPVRSHPVKNERRRAHDEHWCPPAALTACDSTRQPAWAKWRPTTIHLSPLPRRQGVLRFADLSAFLFVNKQRENSRSQYKEQRQHAGRQCCVYSEELSGGCGGVRGSS